ncbi:MAG: radical SAM protein [Pseudomonadota bacterium]
MRGESELSDQEDWVCRPHCNYYKQNSSEEERCRGYELTSVFSSMTSSRPVLSSDTPFDPDFKRSFLRDHVCSACPFLVNDCDFTSLHPPENCRPCGGLVLISGLLREGTLSEEAVREIDLIGRNLDSRLGLTPRTAIKNLEEHYLYHVKHDELYEVNAEAFEMLNRCNGEHTVRQLNPDPAFLCVCMDEDLLEFLPEARPGKLYRGRSPIPSLRYLEWLVTYRCNLSCAHCYLGESSNTDFPPDLIEPLLEQFSEMQGLRVLVSGGEPTLYPHFDVLNNLLPDYPVRAVLLSNGLTLDDRAVSKLHFHEVQISLDGMEEGHDMIRGKGAFKKALRALHAVKNAGLDLSAATMVHRGNLGEFGRMKDLMTELGVREWSIDYPCVAGRRVSHPDLAVGLDDAAVAMAYGFGGSYHGTSPGWTCGRHLAAVLPSGDVCRCGLYPDMRYGSVLEGLAKAWAKAEHIPIDSTLCRDCDHAESCGGGCRFRAGDAVSRDEVMCRLYGVLEK